MRLFTRFLVLAISIVSALTLAQPALASGYLPDPVTPGYTGWATVATVNPTVPAWKWASTGWTATSFTPGTSVRAYPWGGGWSWGYRDGSWYALHTNVLAQWSCVPIPIGTRSMVRFFQTEGYRYNTQHSTKFTIDPASIYPLCANLTATADFNVTTFDASLGVCPEYGTQPPLGFGAPAPCNRQPFEAFMLVRATVHPAMPVCGAGLMCPMYMPAPYTTNLYIQEQRAMPG